MVLACKNVIKEASRIDPLFKKLGLREARNEDLDN